MWVSWAVQKPIPVDPDDTGRVPYDAMVLHIAVFIGDSLEEYWEKVGTLESHFYIRKSGVLEQYVDTDDQTDHAWDANAWTVSVETEGLEDGEWTQAQLDTIDRLARELGIPARALDCEPSDGVGYHRQCDGWNKSHHVCPGDDRVAQVPGIIARLEEDDMALNGKELDFLAFGYGQKYRVKNGAGKRDSCKIVSSDGVDRTESALLGFDDKDDELAKRGTGGDDGGATADEVADELKQRLEA